MEGITSSISPLSGEEEINWDESIDLGLRDEGYYASCLSATPAAGTMKGTLDGSSGAVALLAPGIQESPTSPTSPPPEFYDPEYSENPDEEEEDDDDDDEDDYDIVHSPPTTPTNPTRKKVIGPSPLTPFGFRRRAHQALTPRTSPSKSPTSNKLAHKSSPQRYPKLRSKLRKDREREMAHQRSKMTRTKLEDMRLREKLFHQLREKMVIPTPVLDCLKKLVKNLFRMRNIGIRTRIEQYSFVELCDIWRFQNLDTNEFIYHEGWTNTRLDDPEIIRYIITLCRGAAGLPQAAGGGG
ncbi:hypothetical protein TWF281_004892 [Arthrobotrys megalospora]